MTYAPSRGLIGELSMGSVDGTYKQVVRDRGGHIDEATVRTRQDLPDTWYGIHEAAEKVDPFGRLVRTPNYRATRPVTYPWG